MNDDVLAKWQRIKTAADQRRSERDRAVGAFLSAKARLAERTGKDTVEGAASYLEELKKRLAKKAAKLAKGLEEVEVKFGDKLTG